MVVPDRGGGDGVGMDIRARPCDAVVEELDAGGLGIGIETAVGGRLRRGSWGNRMCAAAAERVLATARAAAEA